VSFTKLKIHPTLSTQQRRAGLRSPDFALSVTTGLNDSFAG
jgi:hypothetical protein